MIIGSGLVASAFSSAYADDPGICIYAAGVSNSACRDSGEFEREKSRLQAALVRHGDVKSFVYFGTCSIYEAQRKPSAYVSHKLSMEELVKSHPNGRIFRLPQLAGHSANPHTLLNYLFARISRSEKFDLWVGATRNVIDVQDVVRVVIEVMADSKRSPLALNIANPQSYTVMEIVAEFEAIVGKPALYCARAHSNSYEVDVSDTEEYFSSANLHFDHSYLRRVLRKYYA